MHDQQPDNRDQPTAENRDTPEHEAAPRPTPRIYVASLSDYNNGVLHGVWIDAARDPADIHVDIAAMLSRSKEPGAEEFAIHDYEQFGDCRIHEYDGIELVSRIAKGIQEHGYPFAAWAEVHESTPERFDDFEDAYLGHYESPHAYAEQLAEDLDFTTTLDTLPEAIRQYMRFDADALARDLQMDNAIYVAPDRDGGVWVFDGRI